ncbi:hypothetical protein PVA17_12410 [Lysinibacillus sp. CNPSo 3705]|uniref:hypothetical protein n=1 Tax=Lysinibacillus sp. CNPSo 3705 TaxID=3028148 RepID=UPI002363DB0A|nr:hypothetical protein [Lysinibacillus sp. CNPSo 3705]MDD1503560.1 hypothetical protein [Lysinibacillus sp. CNPSo 3705]
MLSEAVDWSGGWATPWGLAIEERRLKASIGRPQEALLCAKAKRQLQMFSVAKAKRQLQSA